MKSGSGSRWQRIARAGAGEWAGLGVLALLAAWLLHESWRKWADPIIDSGPQWYAIWRVSLGAVPYRDFVWNYGPLSILFNGLLFKWLGPGMMALAAANLLVYAGIVALAYLAFRRAWGRLAAFAALAVFISVFSFSMVNAVGNYNYVLPYTHEVTHGMLLMLATVFVAVRWCGAGSRTWAFLLGLCGGLASVLKPEFMLAGGVLGMAALVLRYWQRRKVTLAEYGLMMAGMILPTILFTFWFAGRESWGAALVDSCQAWWLVLVNQRGPKVVDEASYMGFNYGWRNLLWEIQFAIFAVLTVGAVWAAGWFINRPWSGALRWMMALCAGVLAWAIGRIWAVEIGGGFEIGPCFPGLIAIIFVVVVVKLRRELRQTGRLDQRSLMALALVLLAGTMLTRMALRARINHFGFIQAAFAGMVAAAFIVSEAPRWTGAGIWGRRVTLAGLGVLLTLACGFVVRDSARNHSSQTQQVGSGVDRFYALNRELDDTGATVNWCVQRMQSAPAADTLLVLPEGVMINYLSRRQRPMPEFQSDEKEYVTELARSRPDYVILIWGDQRDGGIPQFGDPGQPGDAIRDWLEKNYALEDKHREKSRWAFVFHKKPKA